MSRARLLLLATLLLLPTLAAATWFQNPPASALKPAVTPLKVDGQTYRLSGPYTHNNLTVFLLHSDRQDKRSFLTLDQGLEKKLVKVTEQAQARVNELLIENTSNDYLFLQEGDR